MVIHASTLPKAYLSRFDSGSENKITLFILIPSRKICKAAEKDGGRQDWLEPGRKIFIADWHFFDIMMFSCLRCLGLKNRRSGRLPLGIMF